MGRRADDKGGHNLISSTSSQHSRVTGNTYSSNDPVGRGNDVVHCSGTFDSFNNYGNGRQNFTRAEINSGKNSGASNRKHHQASNSGGESTRLPSLCSGTQSSFNCHGGSQKFAGAIINSGENSGNRRGPSSSSGASEQQPRVMGTQDLRNDYGTTQLPNRSGIGTVVGYCFGTLRSYRNSQSKLQDFTGKKINSGENLSATTTTSSNSPRSRITGNTCSSNDPVGRGCVVVHCSETVDSFNIKGIGSPNISDAEINSDKNSGASNQNHHQTSNSVGESTRLPNLCSGTQSSFNSYGEGSQKFAGAIINSGENSGNRGGPNVVGYSSGTSRSVSQDFTGAKINSGENSGGS